MYPLVRPLLFRTDPERAHDAVMAGLAWASRHPGLLRLMGSLHRVEDTRLESTRFGLRFPNPVGLAAGLDKNAVAIPAWSALGFGAVEVGSVTALAQAGNPKPRLFRLPADGALLNRMGFNNDGADAVAARLRRLRVGGRVAVPLGVNLGKSRPVPLEQAAVDYTRSLRALWASADYFVVNVSSPNTPGLRALQDKARLDDLLAQLTAFTAGQAAHAGSRPLLLKLAPDLDAQGLEDVLELALTHNLAGLVATNTTTARPGLRTPTAEAGGLSGRPLANRALEVLRYLYQGAGSRLPLISVGGIFGADDVYARLRAGASLVQLYTGFVYQGPGLAAALNRGLVARMERDGFERLEQVIGQDTC